MKIRTVRWLVFFLIGCTIGILHADEPAVVLQVNESSPYWSEKTLAQGMGFEIVQAISKEMGIKTQIEFVPLKRLIADTSNNPIGNPLFYMNNQDFSAIIPIGMMYNSLFTYSKEAKKISSAVINKESRIGILRGTADNMEGLKRFGKLEESYSKESLFKKLKAGRVDVVVELNLVGRETIRKLFPNEIDHFDVRILPETGSPMAILIDSNYPDGAVIGKRYQEGLHRIIKKGVYQKILKKYYGNVAIPAHWYTDLSKYEFLYSPDLGGNGL